MEITRDHERERQTEKDRRKENCNSEQNKYTYPNLGKRAKGQRETRCRKCKRECTGSKQRGRERERERLAEAPIVRKITDEKSREYHTFADQKNPEINKLIFLTSSFQVSFNRSTGLVRNQKICARKYNKMAAKKEISILAWLTPIDYRYDYDRYLELSSVLPIVGAKFNAGQRRDNLE